jgi:hypothetical protein
MNTLEYIRIIRGMQDVKDIQQRTTSPEDFMVQGCPGTMKRNGDNFHPPLLPKRSPPAARRTRGGLSATARFLRSLGEVLLGYW